MIALDPNVLVRYLVSTTLRGRQQRPECCWRTLHLNGPASHTARWW